MTLVEKWWSVGEPTVNVRLAEARSLMALRALDRAYNRLKDLVETGRPSLEALALGAEIQLQRGWQGQARRLAQRGLEHEPGSAAFQALLQRASEAPTEPDETTAESDHTSVAELVRVAEQFLCLGQHVRARSVLERVRRRAPEHRWAADLLWALEGDFSSGDTTLADLCDRLGPDLGTLQDLNDEPEHTESARPSDLVPVLEHDRGFSSLFRNLSKDPMEDATVREAEVTAVSSMADVQQLLERQDAAERTDPHAEDTQILRVQPKSPGRTPPPAPGRAASRDASAPNLAELGSPGAPPRSDFARDVPLGGDDEDDSIVVHLRREDATDGQQGPTDIHGLTEELELEKVTAAVRGTVEDAHWAAAPPPEPPKARREKSRRSASSSGRTPAPVARVTRPGGALQTAWPWWVAVMLGLAALGALLFVLMVVAVAIGH